MKKDTQDGIQCPTSSWTSFSATSAPPSGSASAQEASVSARAIASAREPLETAAAVTSVCVTQRPPYFAAVVGL